MAYYRSCATLSGKYLSRKQRHKRLKDQLDYIEFIKDDAQMLIEFLDEMQANEHSLTPEEFESALDYLWHHLRLTLEHYKKIFK